MVPERGENMELNRCAYTIMGILRSRNAIDNIHGLTTKEISVYEKVSRPSTIYKKVKELQKFGYLDEGVKAGKGKTYYLTEKGIGILPIKREDKTDV